MEIKKANNDNEKSKSKGTRYKTGFARQYC